MRNRITWHNVAAPTFRDALLATQAAGNSFSKGFEGLASIAGDIRERQKSEVSQRAIAQALGITDAQTFADTLANGGLGAFGANAGDLNQGALEFFTKRGSQLTNDANTQARTSTVNYNLNRARTRDPIEDSQRDARFALNLATDTYDLNRRRERDPIEDAQGDAAFTLTQGVREYDFNRKQTLDPILDQRADLRFQQELEDRAFTLDQRQRTIDGQTAADQTKALEAQARQIADQVANSSLNPEEAKNQVVVANLGPELEAEVLRNIDSIDPAQWAVDSLIRDAVVQNENTSFGTLSEGIDSRRVSQNIAYSSDQDVRVWTTSLERFEGSTNPMRDVLQRQFGDSDDSPELQRNRGQLMDAYNDYVKKYDLPPEVVAHVMEENLKGSWSLNPLSGFTGTELKPDHAAIDEQLSRMSTPAARNRLEHWRKRYERQNSRVDNFQKQLDKLIDTAALARRNGDVQGEKAANQAADKLLQDFQSWSSSRPVYSGSRGSSYQIPGGGPFVNP